MTDFLSEGLISVSRLYIYIGFKPGVAEFLPIFDAGLFCDGSVDFLTTLETSIIRGFKMSRTNAILRCLLRKQKIGNLFAKIDAPRKIEKLLLPNLI